MNITNSDILIVGAGLSGLMAANVLHHQGLNVTVVDKGRSVGGRLATRRIGPGRADHGAQFFSVRTREFHNWVDGWIARGLVYRWSTGWSDGSLAPQDSDGRSQADGHPRYAVNGGMNALAKHLAQGLDIRTYVRLVSLSTTPQGWQATAENGQLYLSETMVLTPPVPQSLALLEAGQTLLALEDKLALDRIDYAPCVAGLFWVEGKVNLPEPGAVQRPDEAISWIVDNQRKGVSPEAKIITVHASPDYSRELWNLPQRDALARLQQALNPFFDPATQIIDAQLKQWRYARSVSLHSSRCLTAKGLPLLVFAGDAFGGPTVEGAALSGLAAAATVEGKQLACKFADQGEPTYEH